ncbi:MAG: transcriptional repressor [Oscillospiraceae bacterium]|nr:transcriptional repressor [Oscillospiraceae bacterium]
MQRQVVLDAVLKLNAHPTIEEVYAEINVNHPSISKTTVYRNLRQLAGNGVIGRISLPDGLERYDKSAMLHYHFVCKECECIYDVELDHLDGVDDFVQSKYGFKVDGHGIAFTGTCQKCQNKKPELC